MIGRHILKDVARGAVVRANDNAFRTILELIDAYRRQKANERKPK